jgi:putative proteasome-type protease
MTYCLAMQLDEGLLFLADTRTNAGVDDVGVVRKLHVLVAEPDRVLVLASAGNLGTTQEVLDRLGRDPSRLTTAAHLFEVALGVGQVGQEVVAEHKEALGTADATVSFILGGQIGDDPPDLLRIYPEGNYVRASEDRPFLQIGETKYGKFILELGAAARLPLAAAAKVAVTSMMSTARENVAVGPPYDLAIYRRDSFRLDQHRIDADDPFLAEAAAIWERHLLATIEELPPVELRGDQ